jgi:broad specificity phosphatase PhoE
MIDQSIYLVCDRETAFNADGRLRGLADPDLNTAGLGQAKSLASALASAEPSTIVSSPRYCVRYHLTPSRTGAEVDCPAITLDAARPVETVPSRPRSTLRIRT